MIFSDFFVFILYFSEFYCIFYGFLKLIWFSKNINKNGNSEKSPHSATPASAHEPNTVGPARRWNDPGAGPCLRHGARAHPGDGHRTRFTGDDVATGRDWGDKVWRHRWLQDEDHCRRAPDKVSGAEAHWSRRSMMRWAEIARRRCPTTAAMLREGTVARWGDVRAEIQRNRGPVAGGGHSPRSSSRRWHSHVMSVRQGSSGGREVGGRRGAARCS
jgi:hypothetical protein